MMYESPIEILVGKMQTQMEDDLVKAVQSYHINVDKDELIKALRYDREQYEKGYDDCRRSFLLKRGKWIWYDDWQLFECSECGGKMPRNVYDYCPWCGAYMGGEPDADNSTHLDS